MMKKLDHLNISLYFLHYSIEGLSEIMSHGRNINGAKWFNLVQLLLLFMQKNVLLSTNMQVYISVKLNQ